MMSCRIIARRICARRLGDLRRPPASAFRPCSGSMGHIVCPPSYTPSSLGPSLLLSRSLSLTCRRHESFSVQDADDFTERVINSSLPVLVDFHAQWCGPCKILGPRLEKAIAKQQGRVTMAKVDIDDHTDLAIEYGVSAVPTVIAMRGGNVVDQFVGIKDEAQLDFFVGKLIGQ
ncbi:thioredoxin, mitochondrial-like [Brienomyrus brachyistius]|uniref:thioredoxin, mitochondrial-like n=1 Tax=Brienomyrus brachyistius TaxID=42636 RepID=UPI0020B3F97C|nr:thioredoxin, mitochondrial-like [Brienomyrus brachyistius]